MPVISCTICPKYSLPPINWTFHLKNVKWSVKCVDIWLDCVDIWDFDTKRPPWNRKLGRFSSEGEPKNAHYIICSLKVIMKCNRKVYINWRHFSLSFSFFFLILQNDPFVFHFPFWKVSKENIFIDENV